MTGPAEGRRSRSRGLSDDPPSDDVTGDASSDAPQEGASMSAHPGGDARGPRWRWLVVASVLAVALVVAGVLLARYRAAEREAEQGDGRDLVQAEQDQQRQEAEEADRAAEEFFTALDAHRQVWSAQAVADVDVVGLAIALPAQGTEEDYDEFADRCDEQTSAIEGFEVLGGSERPALTAVAGTSAEYERAQAEAERSARFAQAEREFLIEGRELSAQLLAQCRAWAQAFEAWASAEAAWGAAIEEFTMDAGESQTASGRRADCAAGGCLPLIAERRAGLADAIVSFRQAVRDLTAGWASQHCLEGYAEYCDLQVERSETNLENWTAVAAILRGQIPATGTLFPGYDQAVDNANQADRDLIDQGEAILSAMDADTGRWPKEEYRSHLRLALATWQDRVEQLAEAALDLDEWEDETQPEDDDGDGDDPDVDDADGEG